MAIEEIDIPGLQTVAQASAKNNLSQRPEELSIKSTEGYETLVKEMQYYLLYALPEIVVQAKQKGHLVTHEKIKELSDLDKTGNTSLISKLARANNISVLRRIPPNVLSSLVPMLEIYKTTYSNKTEKAFMVDFDDTAIPKGQSIANSILGGNKGGLDLANIVSFNYQLIGTNPAESETNITANLKLKFQTIDALLTERYIFSTDKKIGLKFRYADLVNQAKRNTPEYYRLKVKVGYRGVTKKEIENLLLTGDNVFDIVNNNKKIDAISQEFADAINNSHLFLYVYPVAHDLNFNENGTIDLNIDFRGSIERALIDEDSNVLITEQQNIEIKNAIERAKQGLQTSNRNLSDSEAEKAHKNAEKNLKNTYRDENVNKLYSGFIEKLYSGGFIKTVRFDMNYFGAEKSEFSADTITNNSILRETLLSKTERIQNLEYASLTDDTKLKKIIDTLKQKVAENKGSDTSSGASSTNSGKIVGLSTGDSNLPDTINFVFLKDIYRIALELEGIKDKFNKDNIFIILGNILLPASRGYANLAQQEKFFVQSDKNLNVDYVQYNIGNLPISLEYFNKWYFETIVRPGRTEWKFKNFFYDLMELIRIATMNIFGSRVTGTPGSRTLVGMATADLDEFKKISGSQIIDFSKKEISLTSPTDPAKLANILYLYTPGLIAGNINPLKSLEMEEKYNLFTFTVGSNVGLLKKISYKKMEIQGLRESRATREGELETGTFRMKYDSDIDMYGPCYFLPGDYVIINPVFLSKESTSKTVVRLANDLGLGGIYMVLKTNTEVSRDGIHTKLETIFQSYGNLIEARKATINDVAFARLVGVDPAYFVDREALSDEEKVEYDSVQRQNNADKAALDAAGDPSLSVGDIADRSRERR